VPLLLCALWQAHYIHRTFIFPFRIRATGKTMPCSWRRDGLRLSARQRLDERALAVRARRYPPLAEASPLFFLGAAVFVAGLAINVHADNVLLGCARPARPATACPEGGLYRFITNPNYFGEILEWTGFALASWSLSGLAFLVFTVANLAPRAVANHRWYREKFADYPAERRVLGPGRLLTPGAGAAVAQPGPGQRGRVAGAAGRCHCRCIPQTHPAEKTHGRLAARNRHPRGRPGRAGQPARGARRQDRDREGRRRARRWSPASRGPWTCR
jgi:hypothetical protein